MIENTDISLRNLRNEREAFRRTILKKFPTHTSLIDEPYMAMKYMDLAERVIEYRMNNRAVIVDLYNEPVLDSFFGNIGADDSIRVLTIFTPNSDEILRENIIKTCIAWVFTNCDEDEVLSLIKG